LFADPEQATLDLSLQQPEIALGMMLLVFMMILTPPLTSLIDSLPSHLRVSVIAERLDGQILFAHGADEIVPSASVIKIPILAVMLEEARAGRFDLDGIGLLKKQDMVGGTGILQAHPSDTSLTWRRLAELMISVSDNSATNAIVRELGMDTINRYLADWGLEHTRLRREMMDFESQRRGFENTTTPREMNAILRRFAGNKEFIDILLLCEDQTTIPAGLPSGVRFAHKTGTLTMVRGDAGILLGHNPVVVTAFVRGFRSEAEAEEVLTSIGAAITDYME
jgi:beta-lactamase class A